MIKEARESKSLRDLAPIKLDALKALDTYWNDIPRDERDDPSEDAQAGREVHGVASRQLGLGAAQGLAQVEARELVEAGYPEAEVKAFLDAYHELEQAEDQLPGRFPEAAADAMLASSRELGESVNPTKYPTVAMIERETHFNAMNPFWQAPFAYGTALVLLAGEPGFTGGTKVVRRPDLGQGFYRIGHGGLAAGIALEIYGFYLESGSRAGRR